MRTTVELRGYASDFQKYHNGYLPVVFVVREGVIVRNAEKTSEQRPWGSETYPDFSWIEYWRAFANSDGSGRTPEPAQMPNFCSDPHHKTFYRFFKFGFPVGAHVKISLNGGRTWSWQTYIVPLCSECNGKHGQIVNVQLGTWLVEVVNPAIEQLKKHINV